MFHQLRVESYQSGQMEYLTGINISLVVGGVLLVWPDGIPYRYKYFISCGWSPTSLARWNTLQVQIFRQLWVMSFLSGQMEYLTGIDILLVVGGVLLVWPDGIPYRYKYFISCGWSPTSLARWNTLQVQIFYQLWVESYQSGKMEYLTGIDISSVVGDVLLVWPDGIPYRYRYFISCGWSPTSLARWNTLQV